MQVDFRFHDHHLLTSIYTGKREALKAQVYLKC